jgi:NADH-quinone oxidoreductase subunit N
MVASILPEILMLVIGMLILVVEPFWKNEKRRNVGWLTAGGLFVVMIVSLLFGQPGEPTTTLGGMVRFDWLGFFFKMLFIFSGAVTALLFMDNEKIGHRGEAYIMLLASLIGMDLMGVSADLIMLFLAIETTSIPLYILSGFLLADERSTEAGFKYFLFGTFTSTIMLYGFSLVFGFSGTTDLYQLADMFNAGDLSILTAFGVLALILVGLGFKVSFVPFHFWAPDVYEGAPTPVSGFLSTASKAAGFAVIIRLFFVAFPNVNLINVPGVADLVPSWTFVIAIIAAITMTVGRRQADDQPPGECAALLFQVELRALHLLQDAACMLQQPLAGLGEHHAAPVALEQRLAQFDLERTHLPAQRRLRHLQVARRLREAAELGNVHEVFELLQVHRHVIGVRCAQRG